MRWLLRLVVAASVIRLSSHQWLAITWNCKNQNYRHLFGPFWLLDTHWLLPLIVAASMLGCSGCSPAPRDLRPLVAVTMKYAVMERAAAEKPPAPAPAPEKREPCKACGGDGILGDGRVVVQCGKCDGKGYIICRDGKCQTNATGR